MIIPKTTWNYSLETEADRVIQAAAQTRQRFYQQCGFFVLPRLIPGKANVVFLPKLDFNQISGFWPAVEKAKLDIPMPVPKRIHQKLAQLLSESDWRIETKTLRKKWKGKEADFWKTLFGIFPDLKEKKIQVEIRPTNFGSVSSFNLAGLKAKSLKIKVYIRLEMSPAQIAEAILSSLFKPELEKQNYGWQETEGVIDFLMQYAQLKEIFEHYQPTLRTIRSKEDGKLAIESQKYLKRLGIPTGEIFSLENDRILIDGKTPKENFSANETKVIRLLVTNKNQLCSFDQIGDVLWEDSVESFSVWAISKLIQRIRNKLQANGVSPAVIQTQRGHGYILKD